MCLLAWMEPCAIESVSQKVYSEMNNMKDDIRLKINSITPEFLVSWDVGSTVGGAMANHAPALSKLLLSTCKTTCACKENTVKVSRLYTLTL